MEKTFLSKGLKNSWGIGETKRHDQILKVAQGCIESYPPHVSLTYVYQMVCFVQVQFREDGGLVQGGKDLVDEQ